MSFPSFFKCLVTAIRVSLIWPEDHSFEVMMFFGSMAIEIGGAKDRGDIKLTDLGSGHPNLVLVLTLPNESFGEMHLDHFTIFEDGAMPVQIRHMFFEVVDELLVVHSNSPSNPRIVGSKITNQIQLGYLLILFSLLLVPRRQPFSDVVGIPHGEWSTTIEWRSIFE